MATLTAEGKGEALHLKKFGKYYAHKVLSPSVHRRLVESLDEVSHRSGVPKRFIYQPIDAFDIIDSDKHWVVNAKVYKQDNEAGYLVQGDNVEERCMAIAGAFLRNFIQAEVLPMGAVTDMLSNREYPMSTVVVIPNFHNGVVGESPIPAWRSEQIIDWLQKRSWGEDTITVLGVKNPTAAYGAYGSAMKALLQKNFR